MTEVDFGQQSADYARHRPGFPASFYERLKGFVRFAGTRALDLGTGPGVVALELARRGARVTGLDVAENQIAAAKARAVSEGLSEACEFLVRPAEETQLPAGAFDLVTAGQCWLWFDEARALAEIRRVLRPGGALAVAHYCYLPGRSEIAHATEDLILKHNPAWTLAGHTGLYPGYMDALLDAGFEQVEQLCYDHDQPFTHASWRGRIRTCNGVGSGGMPPDVVEAFDQELQALLRERSPTEPFLVPHRVWLVVGRSPCARGPGGRG